MDTDGELDDDLMRAFGAAMLRFNRRRLTSPPGSRLDLSAFRILWLLVEQGNCPLGEIADQLGLDQSTVSRQVTAAVKRGLLERASTEGTSQVLVRPTALGRERYDHDLALRSVKYHRALHELGPDRTRALVDSLEGFLDAWERAEAAEEAGVLTP